MRTDLASSRLEEPLRVALRPPTNEEGMGQERDPEDRISGALTLDIGLRGYDTLLESARVVIKMQTGFQELLDEFLLEARERADEVESMLLRLESSDPEVKNAAIARVRRELHTLKGNSGMMGFSDLQELAHRMEDHVDLLDLDRPQIDGLLAELDVLRQGLESAGPPTDDSEAASSAAPTAAYLPSSSMNAAVAPGKPCSFRRASNFAWNCALRCSIPDF